MKRITDKIFMKLLNLKIKTKTIILTCTILLLFLSFIITIVFTNNELSRCQTLTENSYKIINLMRMVRLNENIFFCQKKTEVLDTYSFYKKSLLTNLKDLSSNENNPEFVSNINILISLTKDYDESFGKVVKLMIEKGLDRNEGIYKSIGENRSQLLKHLSILNSDSRVLLVELIQMELQYELYGQNEDIIKFGNIELILENRIKKSPLSEVFEKYIRNFYQMISIDSQIKGTVDEFNQYINKIEPGMNKYIRYMENFIVSIKLRLLTILVLLTLVFFLILIFIIRLYTKTVINPIIALTKGIKSAASGSLDINLPAISNDEIGILVSEFNKLFGIWKEKMHMEKFVSKSTIDFVNKFNNLQHHGNPERKEITIFFSDIRGFTAYSESNDPMVVLNMLNQIFEIQVSIIDKYEGDIDKFVGDEIVAQFACPQNALDAAVEIQKEIQKAELLEIGIGLNCGDAIVGPIGFKDSYDWTCIGDTVNLCARLCSMSPGGKILVTDKFFNQIAMPETLKAKSGFLKVKGKKESVKIYII